MTGGGFGCSFGSGFGSGLRICFFLRKEFWRGIAGGVSHIRYCVDPNLIPSPLSQNCQNPFYIFKALIHIRNNGRFWQKERCQNRGQNPL
jgi:hypothetical protein